MRPVVAGLENGLFSRMPLGICVPNKGKEWFKMRLEIELPPELEKEARALAKERGLSPGEFLLSCVMDDMKRNRALVDASGIDSRKSV